MHVCPNSALQKLEQKMQNQEHPKGFEVATGDRNLPCPIRVLGFLLVFYSILVHKGSMYSNGVVYTLALKQSQNRYFRVKVYSYGQACTW